MARITFIEGQRTSPFAELGGRVEQAPQIGAGLQEVGRQVSQFAEQKAKSYDQSNLTQAQLEMNDYVQNQKVRLQEAGDQIYTFKAQEEQGFQKFSEELRQKYNFVSPEAEQSFNVLMQTNGQRVSQSAELNEITAIKARDKIVRNQAIDSLKEGVFNDPNLIKASVQSANLKIDNSPFESANERLLEKEEVKASMYETMILGMADRDPEAAKARMAQDDVKEALTVEDQQRLEKQIEQEQRLNNTKARSAMADAKARLSAGLDVPAPEMDELRAMIASATPETKEDFARLVDLQQYQSNLNQLTPVEVENQLTQAASSLREGGATMEELDRLNAAQKTLSRMKTEIKNDPMVFAAKRGEIDLEEIDLESLESLETRAKQARTVGTEYGNTMYFTAAEASAVSEQLKTLTPNEKMVFYKRMYEGAGDLSYIALGQLSDSGLADAFAGATVIREPSSEAAIGAALRGIQIQAEDKSRAVSQSKVNDVLFRDMGESLKYLNPKNVKALRELMAGWAVSNGLSDVETQLDTKEVAASLMGTTMGSRNGDVILPNGVDEGQFNTLVEGLTASDMSQLSTTSSPPFREDGQVMDASIIVEDGQFNLVAPNKYLITIDDEMVVDAAGQPYILQIEAEDVERLQ